ncbi:TolB family protein [Fictibacillus sp. NPDC058756]|uniref:TolB family protein n=1 Tax=Fictibacillus sp. NPDC058756 TaxID=3346625 RepID=UPI00368783E1
MKRLTILLVCMLIIIMNVPSHSKAAEGKAAFIRKDGLWLKDGDVERRLVEGTKLSHPKFSSDGMYISYMSGEGAAKELWVYNRVTRLKRKVFTGDVEMPRWSPGGQLLAFKSGSVLNVINVSKPASSFQNVTLGAGNYSWTPDSKGFVVSSSANLLPDGWTPVQIFTVPADTKGDLKKVKKITTLPEMSESFFAIGTTQFKWGMKNSVFAFIACPTASMSADSNTLMIVSKNGSTTKMIANMLNNSNWFHWSLKTERLAYIKGIGRLISENKRLTVWDSRSGKGVDLGFHGYADGDFTWRSDREIVVSRQIEWGWEVTEEKRSKPFLALVDTTTRSAKRLTQPVKIAADEYPKTLPNGGIVWVRSVESFNQSKVMKKVDPESKETVWIDKLAKPAEEYYGWPSVLDVYQVR